jgi:hypothetical protein
MNQAPAVPAAEGVYPTDYLTTDHLTTEDVTPEDVNEALAVSEVQR